MDRDPDLPEVQCSSDQLERFRSLGLTLVRPFDPSVQSDQYLDALWGKLRTQPKHFDDFSKDDPVVAAAMLASPSILHCEALNGHAYVCVKDLNNSCDPHIHFVVFDKVPIRDVVNAGKQVVDLVFRSYPKVSRISANIPDYVEDSMKFATLLGFKFEGERRKAILYQGHHHNVKLYGLLREDWQHKQRQRGVN